MINLGSLMLHLSTIFQKTSWPFFVIPSYLLYLLCFNLHGIIIMQEIIFKISVQMTNLVLITILHKRKTLFFLALSLEKRWQVSPMAYYFQLSLEVYQVIICHYL